jgi:hypothetical protein
VQALFQLALAGQLVAFRQLGNRWLLGLSLLTTLLFVQRLVFRGRNPGETRPSRFAMAIRECPPCLDQYDERWRTVLELPFEEE